MMHWRWGVAAALALLAGCSAAAAPPFDLSMISSPTAYVERDCPSQLSQAEARCFFPKDESSDLRDGIKDLRAQMSAHDLEGKGPVCSTINSLEDRKPREYCMQTFYSSIASYSLASTPRVVPWDPAYVAVVRQVDDPPMPNAPADPKRDPGVEPQPS